jgi:hypothetical protein
MRTTMIHDCQVRIAARHILVAAALSAGLLAPAMKPQAAAASGGKTALAGRPSRYQPNRFSYRAGLYYGLVWGVDSLTVRSVESGEIIRFSYHVTDATKARQLNDQKAEPSLIDPQAGVKLVVPSVEQVGLLRQRNAAETGKQYWMAFSNKGRVVKRGDRVIVVIGKFRAEGLVVD